MKSSKLLKCPYCGEDRLARGLHTHIARTHLGSTKYSSGHNGKYDILSERSRLKRKKLEEEYLLNPNFCKECRDILEYSGREKKKQFCNSSCSAVFANKKRAERGWTPSLEHRRTVSEKMTGRVYVPPHVITLVCEYCILPFEYLVHSSGKKSRKFCSAKCKGMASSRLRTTQAKEDGYELEHYKLACKFRFNLKDFPTEFEFSLIEKFGWYKAKNHGNNLTGVSRDHMFSVVGGWDNNIPAENIRHPANCRLLKHGDNSSKGKKSCITYEELLERIRMWDLKYSSM